MKPGPKPTATVIKLARGNPGKRALNPNEPRPEGRPKPPKPLSGRALALWKAYVSPAWWLTRADGHTAYMWALLAAEFEESEGRMLAARIGQLRSLAGTLGFDPGSRARFGAPLEKDAASGYFD